MQIRRSELCLHPNIVTIAVGEPIVLFHRERESNLLPDNENTTGLIFILSRNQAECTAVVKWCYLFEEILHFQMASVIERADGWDT